jgi:hypothetical protein
MRSAYRVLTMAFALLLTACAAPKQNPISFSKEALTQPGAQSIGIYVSRQDKPDTYFDGADCLLCMATASVANQSLTGHTQTLPLTDLDSVKQDLLKRLTTKGAQPSLIDQKIDLESLNKFSPHTPNHAYLDFRPLKDKLKVQKLLVVEIKRIGFLRTYSAYVPTSDPKATIVGKAYIVDLSSNAYNWYQENTLLKAAGKQWSEPPAFPGLTNTYYELIEQYKDLVLQGVGQ